MLTARETHYKGIKMRSRLEATFAAACDRKALTWTYEPRCYASDAGQWLPDFEITYDGRSCFVDVKPPTGDWAWFLPRMEIAWQSEPDAVLMLWTPEGGWIATHLTGWWPMDFGNGSPDDDDLTPVGGVVTASVAGLSDRVAEIAAEARAGASGELRQSRRAADG